jgi:hypothetical protein
MKHLNKLTLIIFLAFALHLCHGHFPTDCSDPSIVKDDKYFINPCGLNPVLVSCYKGWTIVLNRENTANDAISLNKKFDEYVVGFEKNNSVFWIGLEHIRNLVRFQQMKLRIEAEEDGVDSIEYDSFYIGSNETKYRMRVGKKTTGTLDDTFENHNGNAFSEESKEGLWWLDKSGEYTVCLTCKRGKIGHWNLQNKVLNFKKIKMMLKPRIPFRPANCYDILSRSKSSLDGSYKIYLSPNSETSTTVYCEMSKGGWTRILNRIDTKANFDHKSFSDYQKGFGNEEENHWLGLENMQRITSKAKMTLRIELANDEKDEQFIEYPDFLVHSLADNFKLQIREASSRGTLYDWLYESSNNLTFNHKDFNRNKECMGSQQAGWWYPSTIAHGDLNLWKDYCYNVCLTCTNAVGQWGNKTYTKIKMLVRPTVVS